MTCDADVHEYWVCKFEYKEQGAINRYIMSLRWALSQFSGGMDEVTPTRLEEHFYSLVTFLLCFWGGTVIVSLITSQMTHLYITNQTNKAQVNTMRRFLRQKKISRSLSLRITRNAQNTVISRASFTPESDIGMQDLVSPPLCVELHFEMYAPTISSHIWFRTFMVTYPYVVHKICHTAMTNTSAS